jgi:GNAT superfamily N-acetyltransferase
LYINRFIATFASLPSNHGTGIDMDKDEKYSDTEMDLLKIIPSESRLWEQVWRLYSDSFPEYERRGINSHLQATDDPAYFTEIALDNGNLTAILFYWRYNSSYIYLEHLAVRPEMRGQHIGSRLLGQFLRRNNESKIILEIDPPIDEISEKRLEFYNRAGFSMNNYAYTHPSYSKNGKVHELKLLSAPGHISPEEFEEFTKFMNDKVLRYID